MASNQNEPTGGITTNVGITNEPDNANWDAARGEIRQTIEKEALFWGLKLTSDMLSFLSKNNLNNAQWHALKDKIVNYLCPMIEDAIQSTVWGSLRQILSTTIEDESRVRIRAILSTRIRRIPTRELQDEVREIVWKEMSDKVRPMLDEELKTMVRAAVEYCVILKIKQKRFEKLEASIKQWEKDFAAYEKQKEDLTAFQEKCKQELMTQENVMNLDFDNELRKLATMLWEEELAKKLGTLDKRKDKHATEVAAIESEEWDASLDGGELVLPGSEAATVA